MIEYVNNRLEFYPSAKVIADSLNTVTGDRLTTMVVSFHRYILSEFNTHRVFSRNFSSSRAIPIEKYIQKVIDDNVYPLSFGKNRKGMQASEEIIEVDEAKRHWEWAREDAIHRAKCLIDLGIHKQVVNRILEPFSTVTGIISSTEWQNFFIQRCSRIKDVDYDDPDVKKLLLDGAAQPEMQAIANEMRKAYEASKPQLIEPGVWHLPFISNEEHDQYFTEELLQISVGRCARVSYLNHEGVRNIKDDIALHDKLMVSNPPHYSPTEHQAQASSVRGYYGNFTGWKQYRKTLEESKIFNL